MITSTVKDVKVVLKLAKGSQTIGGCNESATDDQLHALGLAVSNLEKENLETISKVTETLLISE